jgi:rhodanese-related sulfurtransferase
MKVLDAHDLMAALKDGHEIALIDVREQSAYGQGHPLLAINTPLSHLELIIRRYVPLLTTRIVVLDDEDGLAKRAVRILASAGYTDLSVLSGGVTAWNDAGFELFQGNYTLTNAFGLFVSEHYDTPAITAVQLQARLEAGEDLVILDSRPMSEYNAVALPGSIDVPGPEQIYHFQDLVPDHNTPIAVTCAGKTRGALGCQALINAGVPNPLFAVEHGTMGWVLAGLDPERGAARKPNKISSEALAWSEMAGQRLADRFGVRSITAGELEAWRSEEGRTLYIIDVRTAVEYEAGHLKGSIWVPGGELTGCTEDHLATRNARLCLVDDNGVRASACAMWMMQMGWPDVVVLEGGVRGHELIKGHEPDTSLPCAQNIDVASIDEVDLEAVTIVDVSSSSSYWQNHIPGALWAVRSALPQVVEQLETTGPCIVISDDDQLSQWAAADLAALGCERVAYLMGGKAAWKAAGKACAQGMERPLTDTRDVYAVFAERPDDTPEAVKRTYLNTIAWREQLLEQFRRDGTVEFLTT